MTRLKSGISQIGGKFRLLKTVLQYIPLHEFYLEPFLGSAIVLLNKPRCRYECGNDFDSELINYLLMTREHPKEFDELKQGIFGLVSQEICNRIVNGKLQAKNDLERAYFFYYLNKLSFGNNYEVKGFHGILDQKLQPERIDAPAIEQVKAQYRGVILPTVCKDKSINEAKANYKGVSGMYRHGEKGCEQAKESFNDKKWQYKTMQPCTPLKLTKEVANKAKKKINAAYKGINPKTTRPYSNNDCGLLTPLDMKAVKRLRFVNLTSYDFRKVYDLFYKAFYERKGLERECFVYWDPPYCGTESYYGNKFPEELHQALVDRLVKSPFNNLLSIGGECEELYVKPLKEAGWFVEEVFVKYSTDANSQKKSKEYLIMNYDIERVPKMIHDHQVDIRSFGGRE